MDEKLRVGVIGAGMFAMYAHVPALKMTGRAKIIAVCRRNSEKLAMAKAAAGAEQAYTDWREMIDTAELDAVLICTPHRLHCEQTIASLEHGLHVLVEKPMALTAEEGWAMVDAARQADRVLMPAYVGRMMPAARALKQTLDAGRIGQVRQIALTLASHYSWTTTTRVLPEGIQAAGRRFSGLPDAFFDDWQVGEDYWRGDLAQNGGGCFADNGAHMVDMALWLGGAPATDVVAFMDAVAPEIERFVSVQARLSNGVMVTIQTADVNKGIQDSTYATIVGDDGVLTGGPGKVTLDAAAGREEIDHGGPTVLPSIPFVNALLDGTPPPIPAEAGAHAAAFSEAVYRSAAGKRIVSL